MKNNLYSRFKKVALVDAAQLAGRLAATFGATLVTTLAVALVKVSAVSAAERPPQFVLFAFDGSKSTAMWKETQDFANTMSALKSPVKFTYFINTAYYLTQQHRAEYVSPRNGAGASAIGFGGTWYDVAERFVLTNHAFENGHEIANHATGHWDGSQWTASEWTSELNQFYTILFDLFQYNSQPYLASYPHGWKLKPENITGFRAPQLGQNQAMYQVLPQFQITYDTSKTSRPDMWPFKDQFGTWMYPLASIQVAGTSRKTLSMDYNFYYFQSGAVEVHDQVAVRKFEEQMYQSYLNYFLQNYNGNRAPVHIGHHFSLWNGGAYWNAMKRAVKSFCGLKEVRCVTYQTYTEYLNKLSPQQIATYQKGSFDKLKAYNPEMKTSINAASFHSTFNIKDWTLKEMIQFADPVESHNE